MIRPPGTRPAGIARSVAVPLCLAAGFLVAGCDGGETGGGAAADGGDRTPAGEGVAPAERESATAAGPDADATPGADGPTAGDTADLPDAAPLPGGGGASTDTPPTAGPADTAPAERYFIRLREGTDPERLAARYGLEPLDVIRDPIPALYAALTAADREKLRADSAVVSLAREIHQGDSLRRPPIRGVPVEEDSAP